MDVRGRLRVLISASCLLIWSWNLKFMRCCAAQLSLLTFSRRHRSERGIVKRFVLYAIEWAYDRTLWYQWAKYWRINWKRDCLFRLPFSYDRRFCAADVARFGDFDALRSAVRLARLCALFYTPHQVTEASVIWRRVWVCAIRRWYIATCVGQYSGKN